MGSWNATCGISQLPISAGEKVRVILLLQHEYNKKIRGSGTNYCTDYFRPWFFSVEAEYNDYGSIENIKNDWNSRYMLESFQKWLDKGIVHICDNKNCEVNSPDIKKFETLDDVFNCIERGALLVNFRKSILDKTKGEWISENDTLRVGMFMILESVYKDIIKESDKHSNSKYETFSKKHYNELKEKAIVEIEKNRQVQVEVDNNDVKEFNLLDKKLDINGIIYSWKTDQYFGDMIEDHYVINHYKSILFKNDKVDLLEFIKAKDEFVMLIKAMTYMRKMFIPQTGCGSQSENYNFYKTLAKSMLFHISKKDKERKTEDRQYRLSAKKLKLPIKI